MYLNIDVYHIKGKTHDCIYNLNDGKLYHIGKELGKLIENINGIDKFTDEEEICIRKLSECGILIQDKPDDNKMETSNEKFNFAWIEICDFCNLKCKHCYNESSPVRNHFMKYEDFQYVCEQLLDIGIKRIQIIGGEPFCNKEIKKMIQYAQTKFESIEIFTNGTMLDEQWIDFIGMYNNIKLAFSVYSYIEKEHDSVTMVNGSYKRTLNAIELVKIKKIKYRVATVHMKGCLVGEKNTELFTINPYKDIVRLAGRGSVNLLSPELLNKKLITKETFETPIDKRRVLNNMRGNRCFNSRLYISCDMDIYPCVMERKLSHGNLKNRKLKDLIDNKICSLSKDYIEECNECEFRYACYDCRPDRISDSLYAKPYYCTYDVSKGEWLDKDKFIDKFFKEI